MDLPKQGLDGEVQLLTSLHLIVYVCVRKYILNLVSAVINTTEMPLLTPVVTEPWFPETLGFYVYCYIWLSLLKLSSTSSALPMLMWKMQWPSVGLWKICLGTRSNSMKMRKGNGKLSVFFLNYQVFSDWGALLLFVDMPDIRKGLILSVIFPKLTHSPTET